ncbi:MAG: LytTR family DNA-binding domain-containing protein [Desulfobacterales bacterium]|nr:LytTR family DNA-binding domain-containing protein [Desulfobacterales bacterium]
MKEIRAVIADDEEVLRTGIANLLNRMWPDLDICGQAENGVQALSMIQSQKPEIVFLDIQMPGMTGVEVAKKILGMTKVVFITAYDRFAVEAFESEAVDYILKPVSEQRLGKTIDRLKKQLAARTHDQDRESVPDLKKIIQVLENRAAPDYLRLIKVKTGTELRFVPVSEIIYFKAEDKYTVVFTGQKEFLIKIPVRELENRLDPDNFWRVHRNAIVNVEKVKKITRSFTNQMMVNFQDTRETIAVSRSFEHLFKHDL